MGMAIPDFVIFGAAKAATTSLYAVLSEHPDLSFARVKEPNYFNWYHDRGWDWYQGLFDPADGGVTGEASVCYMFSDRAPERLKERSPDAKLIALLRDPVDRAWSAYWFKVFGGRQRMDRTFSWMIRNKPGIEQFLEPGLYAPHLQRWEEHFSRDNMLLFLQEDFAKDPGNVVRSVCEFLGVDPGVKLPYSKRENRTTYPRNLAVYSAFAKNFYNPVVNTIWKSPARPLWEKYHGPVNNLRRAVFFSADARPKMSDEDHQYLSDYFRQSNADLSEWLGRDLSHWK